MFISKNCISTYTHHRIGVVMLLVPYFPHFFYFSAIFCEYVHQLQITPHCTHASVCTPSPVPLQIYHDIPTVRIMILKVSHLHTWVPVYESPTDPRREYWSGGMYVCHLLLDCEECTYVYTYFVQLKVTHSSIALLLLLRTKHDS